MRSASLVMLGILLTAVMAVSNLVQFALGAMGPLMVEDLGVSRTAFGFFVTAYYMVAALASIAVGRWVDRAGARRAIAALLVLGAVTGVALAVAPSYAWFFPGLVIGGVVAAISNPATNLAVTTVSSGRGLLVGVKQSGIQAGSLLAGLLLPPVALVWGWPAGFLVCAALSLVCLAGIGAVPRSGHRQPVVAAPVVGERGGGRERPDGRVLRLAGYALFMGAGITNVNVYLVLYGHEQVGLSEQFAGWLLAAVGVAAVVARVGSSVLAERLSGPRRGRLLGAMAVGAVVAVGLLALAQVAGPAMLWFAAAAAGLSAAAFNGVLMLMVIIDLPADRTAVASGQVQAAFFLGLCASPPVFGMLVDRLDSYPAGWAWTAVCFGAAALTRLRRAPRRRDMAVS